MFAYVTVQGGQVGQTENLTSAAKLVILFDSGVLKQLYATLLWMEEHLLPSESVEINL